MSVSYLDNNGLLYFWQKIKNTFALASAVPTKTSQLTNDSGFITSGDIPEGAAASTTVPLMDGTASIGSELAFARGDHRHPSDTSKLSLSGGTMTGTLTLSGAPTSNLHAATKKYVDDQSSSKADIASPDFTGTPTVPTATAGTNTTQIASTAFVTTAVANAIAGITGIEYQIVNALPATGEAGVIYLISNSGSGTNSYDEYIYVNNAFEKIGTTDVDLSGYVQDSDLVPITNSAIDTIVAS